MSDDLAILQKQLRRLQKKEAKRKKRYAEAGQKSSATKRRKANETVELIQTLRSQLEESNRNLEVSNRALDQLEAQKEQDELDVLDGGSASLMDLSEK
jgi:hypothetical protein